MSTFDWRFAMLTAVLLGLALLLAAAVIGWGRAARSASRRQRRPARRPERILGVDEVRRIRQHAEEAALQVALGTAAAGRNPHQEGTRQWVLWTTSFNLRLMELETEAFAPVPPVPVLS
jgi:hypothetical protein